MIDILARRAALRALHSYDLAAVENIAVGISAAYIFLDAYSVLIIIIIDGSTVYLRAEQLPAHLPSQGIASAVIVLLGRAESVLIVVAIFVAVRKSVAVVAVALIPALGIVGLLGLRDDNSVIAFIAADESAEAVVLAELYEQLNYTLSTRFCQIYYASYKILKNIICIHKKRSEPKLAPTCHSITTIV